MSQIFTLLSCLLRRFYSYALMGSSGCGKTTLISCIVGVNQLDSGKIEVFNDEVGKNNMKIGYMPQDISLVPEFSSKEMFYLYGTIFGMAKNEIRERYRFLMKLLELPDGNRFVRDCSGGQQRRISFALTLVHEPEILILDEPTVGVDPLLRHKIWEFLVELTRSKNVTVLLSTHYIEEAKDSTHVGLMRNGVQIAEATPQNILAICESATLEDAFLRLSEQQENHLKGKISNLIAHTTVPNAPSSSYQKPQNECISFAKPTNRKIMKALLRRNYLGILRNIE